MQLFFHKSFPLNFEKHIYFSDYSCCSVGVLNKMMNELNVNLNQIISTSPNCHAGFWFPADCLVVCALQSGQCGNIVLQVHHTARAINLSVAKAVMPLLIQCCKRVCSAHVEMIISSGVQFSAKL